MRLDPPRRTVRTLVLAGLALAATGVAAPVAVAAPTGPAHRTEVTVDQPGTAVVPITGTDAQPTAPAGASPTARSTREAPAAADAGWSAQVPVDPGTQTVGLTWAGTPDGTVQVRGRTTAGWTEWVPLDVESDDAPDGSAVRSATDPVYLGHDGVDLVEVQVTRGPLADLDVVAIRGEDVPQTAGDAGVPMTSADSTGPTGRALAQPTIKPRSAWTTKGWAYGNSGCSGGPQYASALKFAVVHHTVNGNTYSQSDVPSMLSGIYTFHTLPTSQGGQGWCDIAYNFVVDRFGTIWQARSGDISRPVIGGHAKGFNTGSVGVSYLGQFEPGASPTAVPPTDAAVTAGARLIAWKFSLAGLAPKSTVTVTSAGSNKYPAGTNVTIPRIVGHRDLGYTACPGQYLYDKLPSMRDQAAAMVTSGPPAESPWKPFATASALVTQQYADIVQRTPSTTERNGYVSKLGDGWQPGQVIGTILQSEEADQKVNGIIRLYLATFQRQPDHGGLMFWVAKRAAGMDLTEIAGHFASEHEFVGKYGQLSNGDFMTQIYENVMGREPDAGGKAFWTAKLDAGMSRGRLVTNFSESAEYDQKAGTQVLTSAVYQDMLQRAADPAGFLYYVNQLNNGTNISTVAQTIFGSDEYAARIN